MPPLRLYSSSVLLQNEDRRPPPQASRGVFAKATRLSCKERVQFIQRGDRKGGGDGSQLRRPFSACAADPGRFHADPFRAGDIEAGMVAHEKDFGSRHAKFRDSREKNTRIGFLA